jgi:hypothetical protein
MGSFFMIARFMVFGGFVAMLRRVGVMLRSLIVVKWPFAPLRARMPISIGVGAQNAFVVELQTHSEQCSSFSREHSCTIIATV